MFQRQSKHQKRRWFWKKK